MKTSIIFLTVIFWVTITSSLKSDPSADGELLFRVENATSGKFNLTVSTSEYVWSWDQENNKIIRLSSYNNESSLAKKGFTEIKLNGVETITEYALQQNYPNPFNPSTIIRYQIPKDGLVTLKVYDILGSEVATLVNEQKATGRYEVNFDATHLASGIYIYKITAGSYIHSKKMLLVK